MMDSYQAIYDAVRSKISNSDICQAIENSFPTSSISNDMSMVAEEWKIAAYEQQRPSVLYRPAISVDGNQWCALYGSNPQDGVCGFGDSPFEAMHDFDNEWRKKLESKQAPEIFPGTNSALDGLGQ